MYYTEQDTAKNFSICFKRQFFMNFHSRVTQIKMTQIKMNQMRPTDDEWLPLYATEMDMERKLIKKLKEKTTTRNQRSPGMVTHTSCFKVHMTRIFIWYG